MISFGTDRESSRPGPMLPVWGPRPVFQSDDLGWQRSVP